MKVYVVKNVNGGMDGMMFIEGHGWLWPMFRQRQYAERFIREHPQKKGTPIIVKTDMVIS